MRHTGFIAAVAASLVVFAASGPAVGGSKKGATASPGGEMQVQRSLFAGNESRLALFGWFGADCKARMPEVDVITRPKKGRQFGLSRLPER